MHQSSCRSSSGPPPGLRDDLASLQTVVAICRNVIFTGFGAFFTSLRWVSAARAGPFIRDGDEGFVSALPNEKQRLPILAVLESFLRMKPTQRATSAEIRAIGAGYMSSRDAADLYPAPCLSNVSQAAAVSRGTPGAWCTICAARAAVCSTAPDLLSGHHRLCLSALDCPSNRTVEPWPTGSFA